MQTMNRIALIIAVAASMLAVAGGWLALKGDTAQALETAVSAERKVDRIDRERRVEKLTEWIRDTIQRWRYDYLNVHHEVRSDTLRSKTIEVWMEIRDEDEYFMYDSWVEERKHLNKKLREETYESN